MRTVATRILAVFAVALGLLGVAATPAFAATATARLDGGCHDDNGFPAYRYRILVDVDPAFYYPDGFKVVYRVWGDDPSSDDLLAGPFTEIYDEIVPSVITVGACSNYNSTFDEDWGEDEIYFGIRIFDLSTGVQREVVESNRVVGYF